MMEIKRSLIGTILMVLLILIRLVCPTSVMPEFSFLVACHLDGLPHPPKPRGLGRSCVGPDPHFLSIPRRLSLHHDALCRPQIHR